MEECNIHNGPFSKKIKGQKTFNMPRSLNYTTNDNIKALYAKKVCSNSSL